MDKEEVVRLVRTHCPLTRAQLELLQTAYDLEAASSRELADALCKSPHTIDAEFKQVFARTGLHDRGMVVIHAQKQGWLRQASECPGCDRVVHRDPDEQ